MDDYLESSPTVTEASNKAKDLGWVQACFGWVQTDEVCVKCTEHSRKSGTEQRQRDHGRERDSSSREILTRSWTEMESLNRHPSC